MTERAKPLDPEALLAERAWIVGIARRLVKDENEADDVAQDALVTALERQGGAGPVRSLRAWLARVVRSRVIDRRRAAVSRTAREDAVRRDARVPPTDELVARADAQRLIAQAVTELPEPYRRTVLLRWFEGLTPGEIAEHTATSRDTVTTRLRRAHEMLRERLDAEFGGDRDRWCAVLLPFFAAPVAPSPVPVPRGPTPVTTTAATALSAGVVLVSTKLKFAVVALVLLLACAFVGGAVWLSRPDAAGPSAASGAAQTAPVAERTPPARRVVVESGEVADPAPTGTGTRLMVWVEDEAGAPVAGACVTAVRYVPSGAAAHVDSYMLDQVVPSRGIAARRTATTAADGVASIDDADPGWWRVDATTARGAAPERGLNIVAGVPEQHAALRVKTSSSLRGRVLDARGSPVVGAHVATDWNVANAASTTDPEGRFALDGLAPGDVTLSVGIHGPPGARLATVRVPDVSDVTLRLPPTGRIEGRVTNEDGAPRADVLVAVEVDGVVESLLRTTSGPDGGFAFEDVPEGFVTRVRSLPADAVHAWPRVDGGELVEPGANGLTKRRAFVLAGETLRFDVVVVPGGVVTGRVTGPDGPVAGAFVWRWRTPTHAGQDWASTTTDAQGVYRFPPDLPGPVALEVKAPGLFQEGLPADVSGALRKGEVPAVWIVDVPESGEVTADLALVGGPPLRGRVVDAAGAPVEGAWVGMRAGYSDPSPARVSTATDGTFALPRVRPGAARAVEALGPDGQRRGFTPVDARAGVPVVGVEIALEARPDDAADDVTPCEVTVRVVDDETGRGLPGASLLLLRDAIASVRGARWVFSGQGDVVVGSSDADGRVVARVPQGTANLAVQAAGYVEGLLAVEAPAQGPCEVRLARAHVISGFVRDAAGAPLAHRAVVAWPDKTSGSSYGPTFGGLAFGEPTKAITRADGGFTVADLPAGHYALEVHREYGHDATGVVRFGPFEAGDQGLDLRLDAPTGADLKLHVVWPDGSPVTAASVLYRAEGERGNHSAPLRADDGRIVIRELPFPVYTVSVCTLGQAAVRRTFRGLRPDVGECELVLSRAPTIEGRVVDETGAPIAGVPLCARPVGETSLDDMTAAMASTGADGGFTLRCNEEGEHEVLSTAGTDGVCVRLLKPVVVSAGTRDVEVGATFEARIRGVLVDESGRAVAGQRLGVLATGVGQGGPPTIPVVTTDDAGHFAFTGLPPDGSWSIAPVFTGDDPRNWRRLGEPVRSGEVDVRLVLPAK